MINELARQIGRYRTYNLPMFWGVSEITDAQLPHLFAPDVIKRCGFLLVVNTEARQKPGQARELEAGGLGPKDEIPIKRIVETFVERANRLPDPTAPEHRLLRHVVRPAQRRRVVRRQYRTSDLRSVLIYKNAMAVNEIDIGPSPECIRHISERAAQQHVVAIEISHDIAIADLGEGPVDRLGLSTVTLAPPGYFKRAP